MKFKAIRLLAAVAGVSAGFYLTAMAEDKSVPSNVVEKVVTGDIAYLNKQLEKAPEKRAIPTVKATAILIAQMAQDNANGDKAEKMQALRAQALKVAEAVAKKDYDTAKTAAGELSAAKGGDNKAVDMTKQAKISLDDVMSTFRKSTVGGRNIEQDLKDQSKNLTNTTLAAEVGARIATIATLTEKMPAATTTGDKLKKWQALSQEMKTLGLSTAEEAGKAAPDKKKVGELLKKLEKNCTDCHNVFRD